MAVGDSEVKSAKAAWRGEKWGAIDARIRIPDSRLDAEDEAEMNRLRVSIFRGGSSSQL